MIGIISDSHNNVAFTKMILQAMGKITHLIHCGDIGKDVAAFLASLPYEVIAVYGNNDSLMPYDFIHKEPYYFTLFNKRFKIMHHPYYLTPDSNIICYGHLHKFECERKKALYINPGEVCAREKPLIEGVLLNPDTLEIFYLSKPLNGEILRQRVC